MGKGDITPVLWGCQLDFNSEINGLAVCYCDIQPAGPCISHSTANKFKKMNMNDELEECERKQLCETYFRILSYHSVRRTKKTMKISQYLYQDSNHGIPEYEVKF
jgi:hypothetical protein